MTGITKSKLILRFRWPVLLVLILLPLLGSCTGVLSVAKFVEQLVLGLILGSIYALIALGYTLVYGVIKLINFAHGDIYMLGAFTGYYILRLAIRWLNYTYEVPLVACWVIAVFVSMVVCALLAVLMERLAYRPLRNSSRIAALITAVGVSFLIENSSIIAFGPNQKSYQPNTLPVYQLQVTSVTDSTFTDPTTHEIYSREQIVLSSAKISRAKLARVRVICQEGTSDWSPILEITPEARNGLVELKQPALDQEEPRPIQSLGYSQRHENGEDVFVINWRKARFEDVTLPPIFSNSNGEMLTLRFHLSGEKTQEEPLAINDQVKPDVDESETVTSHSEEGVVNIQVFSLVIIGTTAILLWGLNLLINRSMFGISMRALSYDPAAAKLMGINTDKVIGQTFAIGGACAAIAGNMVGIYNQAIEPLMGILPGLKAFVAAVVGGIGSIPGAAAGGMIMGLSEVLVKSNISPELSPLSDALAFAILILVLLFKPTGLLGSTVKEKV
jgi:branched-subunit amino acid ABC-type transport system permease component